MSKVITNYERIKSMTVEQMAEWLDQILNQDRKDWDEPGCYHCVIHGTHHENEEGCGGCEFWGGLKQWLEREVENSEQ